jgi:hypothetical protein
MYNYCLYLLYLLYYCFYQLEKILLYLVEKTTRIPVDCLLPWHIPQPLLKHLVGPSVLAWTSIARLSELL